MNTMTKSAEKSKSISNIYMPTLTPTPLPTLSPKLAKIFFPHSVVSPHFQNSQEVYSYFQNLASDLQSNYHVIEHFVLAAALAS